MGGKGEEKKEERDGGREDKRHDMIPLTECWAQGWWPARVHGRRHCKGFLGNLGQALWPRGPGCDVPVLGTEPEMS